MPVLESGAHEPAARTARPRYPRYKKSRRHKLKRLARRAGIWGSGALAALLALLWLTLPGIESLNRFTKTPSILIQTQDGQIVGSFGDLYGEFITFENLPESLIDAVIATEDRNFYSHFGIDPWGLGRAIYSNVRAGRIVQGGSTITQQVAKNVFLTPERSLMRKAREALLALKLEWRYSKQEIMTIYLNRVYLGAGNYGVDAAARRYFGKSGRELSLSESAVIAGLLKAPSRFAPTSNPQLARQRAHQVLLNMQDAGYLTKESTEKSQKALAQLLAKRNANPSSSYYFSDWVVEQLPDLIGQVQDDLVVTTTIDPRLQVLAEKAVTDVMDKEGEAGGASQAALLAMAPDGAIRAMVGGRSYGESQFNRATQSARQPGSAFKPFVYITALEGGMTPSHLVEDKPVSVGKWQPRNYSGKYEGTMELREALAKSVNSVAVQLCETYGRGKVINTARRLGIVSDLSLDPSLALGTAEVSLLELTGAYAHLAANGAIVTPYGILAIKTSEGKTLYQRRAGKDGMALSADTVAMMNDMLEGVLTRGTGQRAQIGRPAAGKTGTTSDYKDAWFMGYTPDLAAGVWVGNDDATPMKKITGGSIPAGIWKQFMSNALAGTPVRDLPTGTWTAPAPLPWESRQTSGYPGTDRSGNRPAKQPETAPHPPAAGDDGFELGPSFWNKLFQ